MTKKVVLGLKKIATVTAVAIAATGAGFWAVKSGKLILQLPYYEVARVIDGDTFVTKENQYIRLASINAPELGYCGADEAKLAMEKLVLGKKLYLKVVYRDRYNRLDAFVYTPKEFVNLAILESGWTYYHRKGKNEPGELLKADQKAREDKVGIFSGKCTQEVNPTNPKCVIKGNIQKGNKYFRYPGCRVYNLTIVQLYLGEKWYCTEKEAMRDGFTKGPDCN